MTGPLVVGLGRADRGDDAVGGAVARAVARRVEAAGLPGVLVVEHEDPTALLDLWVGRDPVVVVDAVCSGTPPGTVRRLETGARASRLQEGAWSATGRGGTHAFGLAAAVELARALHRLPARLVVVGIEAVGFEYGAPLSGPVAAAVPAAAEEVVSVLEEVSADVPR
ncbi:MAG TPA: hydrogenase maturation protease [Nocardioides sp.]|uniref:hydrogenase maturation protease n=1 Tax=Nocardioides sp. TaxID=35761 RepID=UPI002E376F0A|nr:hydrogenase maturation protease [Nocardioides sp.]HEX5087233.1 hydrogenase maturation protease [Nocardioides sp.]